MKHLVQKRPVSVKVSFSPDNPWAHQQVGCVFSRGDQGRLYDWSMFAFVHACVCARGPGCRDRFACILFLVGFHCRYIIFLGSEMWEANWRVHLWIASRTRSLEGRCRIFRENCRHSGQFRVDEEEKQHLRYSLKKKDKLHFCCILFINS